MPTTTTNLYRAILNGTMDGPFVVNDEPVAGLLYPRFDATTYVDHGGVERTSAADVQIVGDEVQTGGGTSMFDVEGWFGHANWRYFCVPTATEYPASLTIKKGKSKRTNRAGTLSGRHYQIEPKNQMTVDAFKGALDNFARNAVAKQVALAK